MPGEVCAHDTGNLKRSALCQELIPSLLQRHALYAGTASPGPIGCLLFVRFMGTNHLSTHFQSILYPEDRICFFFFFLSSRNQFGHCLQSSPNYIFFFSKQFPFSPTRKKSKRVIHTFKDLRDEVPS